MRYSNPWLVICSSVLLNSYGLLLANPCQHSFGGDDDPFESYVIDSELNLEKLKILYRKEAEVIARIDVIEKELAANLRLSQSLWTRWLSRSRAWVHSQEAELNHLTSLKNQLSDDLKAMERDVAKVIGPGLESAFSGHPTYNQAYADALVLAKASALPKNNTISLSSSMLQGLAAGSSLKLGDLVHRLAVENNFMIIYDADVADFLDIQAGLKGAPRAMGLTLQRERADPRNHVYFLHSAYAKIHALSLPYRMLTGPGSFAGLGLQTWLQSGYYLRSDSSQRPINVSLWQSKLKNSGLDLGLASGPLPRSISPLVFDHATVRENEAAIDLQEFFKSEKPLPPNAHIDFYFKRMAAKQTIFVYQYTRDVGSKRITSTAPSAVVYGSSELHRRYASAAYEMGVVLAQYGFAVYTGGAGGMMVAANLGALHAGGVSIGTPILGRHAPKREERPYKEAHTQTNGVGDYTARVELMSGGRDIYLFMPGRNGTLREIASTVMEIEKAVIEGRNVPLMIFHDRPYYKLLVDQLLANPDLLAVAKDHVLIVDSAEELSSVLSARGYQIQNLTPLPELQTNKRQILKLLKSYDRLVRP